MGKHRVTAGATYGTHMGETALFFSNLLRRMHVGGERNEDCGGEQDGL